MLAFIITFVKPQFLHCKLEVIAHELLQGIKETVIIKYLAYCLACKVSDATNYYFCSTGSDRSDACLCVVGRVCTRLAQEGQQFEHFP